MTSARWGIAISERVDSKGRHGMETRYYILSRLVTVREFATAVRGHWGIENNLHWQLDVSFREDECRVCRDHGPANLSVIRRFVLGLLKRDTSCRKGIELDSCPLSAPSSPAQRDREVAPRSPQDPLSGFSERPVGRPHAAGASPLSTICRNGPLSFEKASR